MINFWRRATVSKLGISHPAGEVWLRYALALFAHERTTLDRFFDGIKPQHYE